MVVRPSAKSAQLRHQKVQHRVRYRLDGVLAVQVEIIEGRQSDQSCRHSAVHLAIEPANHRRNLK
jgi:hypothetical protein